jgi:hypothetical protein
VCASGAIDSQNRGQHTHSLQEERLQQADRDAEHAAH